MDFRRIGLAVRRGMRPQFELALLAAAVAGLVLLSRAQSRAPAQRGAAPGMRTAIRITFGEKQERETDYSGSLNLSLGRVVELIPWRFFGGDRLDGGASWTLKTARANMENQPDEPRPLATPGPNSNIVPKGLTAVIDAPPQSRAEIRTHAGEYAFRIEELAGGRVLQFANGDVTVQRVPGSVRISPAPPANADIAAEHDYPSVAIAADGSAWVAWQLYQTGGDRVLVAHSTASGWSAAEPLTPAGDIYRTAIAQDSRGRIWVVWSERQGEAWDLAARVYDGGGWSSPRRLTDAYRPNIFHKLVRDRAGALHLIWVGYRDGASRVLWSKLDGDAWSAPREISDGKIWMPDAATDSKGNLYVAWDGYGAGNYDIYLRRIDADGAMGPIQQVTKSPRFQAHASVAVDANDRLWLAWDEAGANWGKDWARDDVWRGTTLYAERHPRVAVFENGRWSMPADPMAAMPRRYNRFVEAPKLAVDGAGRVWMALEVRTFTAMNRSDFWANNGRWERFLTLYDGDHWRPAAPIPNSSTRPDGAFQLVAAPSGVWAVFANDNRVIPPAGGAVNRRRYEIDFARMDGDSAPAPPALQAFAETPGNAAPVHPHENADVQRARSYRVQINGADLRLVRGDFHRHTEMSPDGAGDGSLIDYYRYMIDAAQMDTGIVSDHNEGGEEYTWWQTEKSIDLFHIAGGFTPLFGYERSVPYPNGHRNVVFPQRGVRVLAISQEENRGLVNTGPILYPYLKQNRGIAMLHSLATDQGSDYRDNDPEVEPLVEIYQGYHANYEYEGAPRAESADYHVTAHGAYRPLGFFWNALAKGYRLGMQSSSDHIATHTSYTMIYTPSTARGDIVESMRKRHAYGATDNIVLDFRARDRDGRQFLMGDAFEASGSAVMHIKALGTSAIQTVEIIRKGKFVFQRSPNAPEVEFDFVDAAPEPGENWYYVRVIQADRDMAWSSPIWIRYAAR